MALDLDLDRNGLDRSRPDRSRPDLRAPRTSLTRAPVLPRGLVAAVGVGVAFGLGVVAGGGIGEAQGASPQAHALAAEVDVLRLAEGRSQVLEEKRERLKLTYAQELTRPEPPVVERAIERQRVPGAGDKAAEGKAAAEKAAEGATAERAAAKAATDEVAASLEPPPPPMPEVKPEPVKLARDDESANDGADASADEELAGAKAEAPREKADNQHLQAALAKVLGGAPAVVDAPAAVKTFALQVASAPTRAGAEELAKKLAAQGHTARVVEGDVGGKAVFRVRIGAFADRAMADAYKAKLATPAFVVSE